MNNNIDNWRVGSTMFHDEYNATLTFIVNGNEEDEGTLVIATVYGKTEKESKDNAALIVKAIKQLHKQ